MKKLFYFILFVIAGLLVIIGIFSVILLGTLYFANKKVESIPCESRDNPWSRNLCYGQKAVREKDPAYCEKITIIDQDASSKENKMLCYVNVARRLKNPNVCNLAKELTEWCRDYLIKNP